MLLEAAKDAVEGQKPAALIECCDGVFRFRSNQSQCGHRWSRSIVSGALGPLAFTSTQRPGRSTYRVETMVMNRIVTSDVRLTIMRAASAGAPCQGTCP